MAKKKVLFLTVPMKGHQVHTLRLVEWFVQYPEDYEVHVHAEEEALVDLPSSAVRHAATLEPGQRHSVEFFPEVLNGCAKEPDWYSTQAYMMKSANAASKQIVINQVAGGIDRVKELHPDVVLCDHGFNFFNYLHTVCKAEGIPLVMITSMGRPETILNAKNIFMMLLKHFSAIRKALTFLSEIKEELEGRYGKPLPESDGPVGIFPSSEILVQGKPPEKHIFVGPFIPQPDQIPVSPEASWPKLNQALVNYPKLARWLQAGSSTPIVYICFGTLVQTSDDLVSRFVEGLSGGNWRVLWSLPSSVHSLLPKEGLSEQWLVESFVPQFALLESGRISAFVSHCGANSTQESLVHGVPMVCMPFYCDQYEWAESVCGALRAGVRLDKLRAEPDDIRNAVAEVLEKPVCRANAESLAQQMKALTSKRLEFLAKPGKMSHPFSISPDVNVGVPVAAAVVDACLRGDDPQTVVAPAAKARLSVCSLCQ
mmetsp:Transcript_27410/g.63862  ORF Transcript_27410/g.63862 Transcript_27410/m.63862 type:complete len:483 (-) Transcript_27410:51-1499(-)